MHRGLAAACAAMVSCLTLYPMDVWKTAGQMRSKRMCASKVYAGLAADLCGSFLGTGVYFTTYEAVRAAVPFHDPMDTALGSACGVLASCIVKTPLSIAKKRRQARVAFQVGVTEWSARLVRQVYLLDVSRGVPRAIAKYIVYERLMSLLMLRCDRRTAAALSAAVAAACAYALSIPIENRKVLLTLSAPTASLRGLSFNGLGRGIVLTVVSNALGHALVETWAPRERASSS